MKWLNTLTTADDTKSSAPVSNETKGEEPVEKSAEPQGQESLDSQTEKNKLGNKATAQTQSESSNIQASKTEGKHVSAITQNIVSKPESNSTEPPKSAPKEKDESILDEQWKQLLLLALLNLCVYFAYQGTFNDVAHHLGGKYIESVNQNYLAQASHDITGLVEVLSASKSLLAVLQSSSGGVSFIVDVQVEIGQSISVLFDAIDRAWQFSLIALTSVEIIKLLLGAAKLITVPIWTGLFILLGLSIVLSEFFPNFCKRLHRLGKSMLIVAATVHFLLPAAVCGTAALNAALYSPQRVKIQESFTQIHQSLPSANKHKDLSKQIKSNMEHVHGNSQYYHKQGSHASHLTTLHVALSFLEFVLSPVLILLGLVMILRRLIWTPN